jgi:SAM-dependent methyltransferase
MKSTDVQEVYDDQYAQTYNSRFLTRPETAANVDFELGLIRKLLGPNSRWLDIGCGTGYFLSQFQDVTRAGMDLSPAMLTQASASNPDALFFRQGDFRQPVPEWQSQWSLISCMWAAYSYVESVQEVEQVVANMVAWTRPGGAIFIPVIDLDDLRYLSLPYEEEAGVFGGRLFITSCNWTWLEPGTGKTHHHLVAPQAAHFAELLAPYFEDVTIIRYPAVAPYPNPRKVVIATGRHAPGDARPPAVIKGAEPLPVRHLSPAALPIHQLVTELGNRLRPGHIWRALQHRIIGLRSS